MLLTNCFFAVRMFNNLLISIFLNTLSFQCTPQGGQIMNGLDNSSKKAETDQIIIQMGTEQPAAEETWKQIWTRKGKAEGGIENLLAFDGYERTHVNMKEVAAEISRRLDIQKEDKVLEVGCGAGALAQYLDCDYTGIDYSPTLVRRHIELLHNPVLVGEAANLPFKDKTFDKVICYGVFLYFDNKKYAQRATEELLRVAKKGVLIGELPIRSHRMEHLLFTPEEFEGWDISDGFYDPYRKDRFNAVLAF